MLALAKSIQQKFYVAVASCLLLMLGGCEYEYTGPGFKIVEENPNAEPWFNVYRPADMPSAIEAKGHLLPVIVWANGGCLRSDFTWQPLFKRWAAEGYVVLAFAERPDGGALSQSSWQEQGQLIDWAFNESPYSDMLDTNGIVAAGNSCGGITALELTANDERVAAVFVLSGSSGVGKTDLETMQAITVPVGYVEGGPTDQTRKRAESDYAAMDQTLPAMFVTRDVAGHVTISTDVAMLEETADIAHHWLDLVLYGNSDSYDELNSENVCSDCTPGKWSLTSRNLERLVQ